MKKWCSVIQLVPALAVALAACLGFQLSEPVLEEVIFPDAPDLSVYEVQEQESPKAEALEALVQAEGHFADGVYTGIGTGFSGKTSAEVTVKDGQITSVTILSFEDDESFFHRAEAVIDRILRDQTWEVDAISGATYSSRGILDAVRNALTGEESESEVEAPEKSESSDEEEYTGGSWQDGTFIGAAQGFSGSIKVSVMIEDGKITSIDVTDHSGETASFYEKAKAIIGRILSAQSPNVDTVSGATYSSAGIKNAVIQALNKAAAGDTSDKAAIKPAENKREKPKTEHYDDSVQWKDGTYSGSSKGFGRAIKVNVTIKGGKITAINVTDHSGETDAYYRKAKKITSSILKAQSPNVDTVSGATYSSAGIKNAVIKALNKASDKGGTVQPEEQEEAPIQKPEPPTEEEYDDSVQWKDGTYSGSTQGFGGAIKVNVTIKDGKITVIDVTDHSGETDAYYNKAKKITSSILKAQSPNVDTVSGATYSSAGIKNAVIKALNKASVSEEPEEEEETPMDAPEEEQIPEPFRIPLEPPEGTPADGTYIGSAECEVYGYLVKLETVFENGSFSKIKSCVMEENALKENEAFFEKAWKGMKTAFGASDGVDGISGATYSSKAIAAAYVDAYTQAVRVNQKEPEPEPDKSEEEQPEVKEEEEAPVYQWKDGTYTASAMVYCDEYMDFEDYELTASVDIEQDRITAVRVEKVEPEDTVNQFYSTNAAKGIQKQKPDSGEFDAVTGATCSSKAFRTILADVIAQAKAAKEAEK